MVIGKGLLGKRFDEYRNLDNFLVFASGVSNSKTKNAEAYAREMELLTEAIAKNKTRSFIYFSTCSVKDPAEMNSEYVKHKLRIEEFIQANVPQYHIFRISNIAGASSNPNTVLNFFYYHVKNGINFDLWTNACRNLIDIDDVFLLVDHIVKHELFLNEIVNVASPFNFKVKEIVESLEAFLNIKSSYIEIDKGDCFTIDISAVNSIIQKLGLTFNDSYLETLLQKYYRS